MSGSGGVAGQIPARFSPRVEAWLCEMVPGDERPVDAARIELALKEACRRRLVPEGIVSACRARHHPGLPPVETLAACLAACGSGSNSRGRLADERLGAAVDELVHVIELDRLEGIARRSWPVLTGLPHYRQIARVLDWLLPVEDRPVLVDGECVRAVFKEKGLIPDSLSVCCARVGGDFKWGTALLPIVFAASIYPQRSYQLDQDEELPERLRVFLKAFVAGEGSSVALSNPPDEWAAVFVQERLTDGQALTRPELRQLMGDLSAVEALPVSSLGELNPERCDREWGAAIYLSTLAADSFEALVTNWRGERPFLTNLRAYLRVPPSSLVEFRGRPEWAKVRASAGACLPEIPPTHLDDAVILTQMVWKKIDQLPLSRPNEHIDEFWSVHLFKLCSGFPYYAFLSRFSYWWKMCLRTHPFRRDDEPIDDDDSSDFPFEDSPTALPGGSTAVSGFEFPSLGEEAGLEFLQSLRDGFRLVRTTFFRRSDSAVVGGKPVDPAEANDEVRRALDALWYERLQRPDEDEGKPEMLQSIAARFPSLGLQTVTNYSHNLPIRMQAYVLARHCRKTTAQIQGIVRTIRTAKGTVRSILPFKELDGWLPVASLVRGMKPGRRLFWAFFAHANLYPRVFPQRPDPWDFLRILREVRYWLDASGTLARQPWAASPSGVASLAQQVDAMPGLRRVLQDLAACPLGDPVGAWQPPLSDRDLEAMWHELLCAIPPDLLRVGQPDTLKELRKLFARKTHWLVPVWYYRCVEWEPEVSLSQRLGMDPDEAAWLSEILKKFGECVNPADPQASPVKEPGSSAIRRGGVQ